MTTAVADTQALAGIGQRVHRDVLLGKAGCRPKHYTDRLSLCRQRSLSRPNTRKSGFSTLSRVL